MKLLVNEAFMLKVLDKLSEMSYAEVHLLFKELDQNVTKAPEADCKPAPQPESPKSETPAVAPEPQEQYPTTAPEA